MTHIFKDQPDERQGDADTKVSRFRPRYRALTAEEKALHDEIKDKAAELEVLFERAKGGRYKALAFTALEAAVMWIVKEITS